MEEVLFAHLEDMDPEALVAQVCLYVNGCLQRRECFVGWVRRDEWRDA